VTRAPSDNLPFVSVVVPVRNGEATIADCLDAILAADYPPDRREILAVDNCSTDASAGLIHARPVRYLHEPKRGVSHARNRGIAESSGEILAFIDADCIVEPQWLRRLVEPFADPEVGCVAGELRHAPPTNAAERQAARQLGDWQRFAFTSNPNYAITANAAYRRDVLDQIGHFDTHLRRAQDVELGLRFHGTGRRLAYGEGAVARHRNRSTQLGFFRQQLGWAYGAGLVGTKYAADNGGSPPPPSRVGDVAGTARGLGIVLVATARGRGERAWVEDAWFDLMRQVAWWTGARAGLLHGARIWKRG
jgi:glycosyltransferase involved in cell wall biosynthesis